MQGIISQAGESQEDLVIIHRCERPDKYPSLRTLLASANALGSMNVKCQALADHALSETRKNKYCTSQNTFSK